MKNLKTYQAFAKTSKNNPLMIVEIKAKNLKEAKL